MLDKVAADYADKGVKLAKIDVDKEKLLAAQFRIQSIPTVYAIYRGQPVADLTNYRSEGQLKKVLDQLLAQLKIEPEGATPQAEIEPLIAMGEQVLAEGDARARGQHLPPGPGHGAGQSGGDRRPRARADRGRRERRSAAAARRELPEELAKKPEIARAKAALEVASAAPAVGHERARERGSRPTPTIMRRGSSSPRRRWRRRPRRRGRCAARDHPPRPRVERRRGAQALPPAARSAGPRRPVVERPAAAACPPCSSHEPDDPRSALPAGRRDPVPALAASAAHLRAALSRDGARRDRRRRAGSR